MSGYIGSEQFFTLSTADGGPHSSSINPREIPLEEHPASSTVTAAEAVEVPVLPSTDSLGDTAGRVGKIVLARIG